MCQIFLPILTTTAPQEPKMSSQQIAVVH